MWTQMWTNVSDMPTAAEDIAQLPTSVCQRPFQNPERFCGHWCQIHPPRRTKRQKRKLLKKKLRRPQSKLLKAAQTMIQFLIHMVILALTGITQDQKHAVITIPRTLLLLSLAACANGMTCQPRPLSSPQITHILTSCSLITSLLSSQKTIANTATTSRTS